VARSQSAALPDFIPPQLATLTDKAPAGGDWIHEIKRGRLPQQSTDARGMKFNPRFRRRLDHRGIPGQGPLLKMPSAGGKLGLGSQSSGGCRMQWAKVGGHGVVGAPMSRAFSDRRRPR
jgi:hypothetical protein